MKKVLFVIVLSMCSLCANAQRECSPEVLDCLDKAMHLSDLQSARSELKRKVANCKSDSEAALSLYKDIRYVDVRIADLAYELRKAILDVPEDDKYCDEMDFARKILEDEDK